MSTSARSTNRQFTLASRPVGMVSRDNFAFAETEAPTPADNQFLVRVQYISLDPAMRGWLNEGKSYVPPVGIGEVMRGLAAGEVIQSNHPDYKVGEHVVGVFGVQDYAISDGAGVTKVDSSQAPLPLYLGTLGMPGITAYFGLLEVGEYREGDTVVVSGAAGAVGSVVGQIAKLKGSRVVGIAGGADKCRHVVEELGFDACIDYKSEDVKAALKTHCPPKGGFGGIDLYFDNVGGDILDAALTNLAFHARIVICGAISQYNSAEGVKGPANYMSLLVSRATMRGMVVFDHTPRYGDAVRDMAGWIQQGKLKHREDIVDGLETFPETLLKLFTGENVGKLMIRV